MTPPRTDLIARMKLATGPDRELEANIYCLLNPEWCPGQSTKTGEWYACKGVLSHLAPAYTESVDAANTLLNDNWPVEIGRNPNAVATHRWHTMVNGHHAFACNEAIALCIAALEAGAE